MPDYKHDNKYWSGCWNAFRKGDEREFSILHDSFFDLLYDYALRLLQDPDLAYDAIQELFLKLWTRRASLPEVEYVRAYLVRSLRTTILNQIRSLKLYELKIFSQYPIPDIEFSPEEMRIKGESNSLSLKELAEVINELPARHKDILFLEYYEGLSNKEINANPNMTPNPHW